MKRIERLLMQIECVEQMLQDRLQFIESNYINAYYLQVESIHQKISLAEKSWQVKNGCSPITRELQ